MKNNNISRRGFLKGAAAAAGAVAGTRFAGGNLIGDAQAAATEVPAVLVIFTLGGYNSIFSSYDSFSPAGTFGATPGGGMTIGGVNNLIVDPTFKQLNAFATSNMATIGTRHGQSAHDSAEQADWGDGTNNYMLQLADAMGGPGTIKAAVAGGNMPQGPAPAVNGTSLQQINDIQSTIDALSGTGDATVPDRTLATKGVTAAQTMSKNRLAASPKGLLSLNQGFTSSITTLAKPPQVFSFTDFNMAYNLGGKTGVGSSFGAQMAAAELMISSGTNVVCAMTNFNWDSHGDKDASSVRNQMSTAIIPALNTFITRNMAPGGSNLTDSLSGNPRNVSVVILGDFARSLPGSDHQPNMSCTVFGKHVAIGTTGKTDANVGLNPSTPGMKGLWSYLAAISGVSANPFGPNPHALTK